MSHDNNMMHALGFRGPPRESMAGFWFSAFSQIPGLTIWVSRGRARDWTNREDPYQIQVACAEGWRCSRVRRIPLGAEINPSSIKPQTSHLVNIESPRSLANLQAERKQINKSQCADIGRGQRYLVLNLQDSAGSNDLAYLQKGQHCEARDGSGECGDGRARGVGRAGVGFRETEFSVAGPEWKGMIRP